MKPFNVARLSILTALALILALLPACALSESGASMFRPESMVSAYNDATPKFLEAVGLDSETARNAVPSFQLELQSDSDGKLVYTNSDSTVVLT